MINFSRMFTPRGSSNLSVLMPLYRNQVARNNDPSRSSANSCTNVLNFLCTLKLLPLLFAEGFRTDIDATFTRGSLYNQFVEQNH
jgi:hypothetical protein